MDWKLTYSGVSFTFGSLESGYGFNEAPSIGGLSPTTSDVEMQGADAVLFGRDLHHGSSISFELDIMAASEQEARALTQTIRRVWRADAIRSTPGAVAALAAASGRIAFGRPRRFEADDTNIQAGVTSITCDFKTVDDLWYGAEQSIRVGIAPALGGGLVAPLASPLATTESSDRSQAIVVGGSLPTWGIYTVTGPISGPEIELVNRWALRFPNLNLAYDQSLVVDTRPWARTILRNGGSVAGMLAPGSSRLRDAVLPPGVSELVLRGTSITGTASLTARWRDAYTTP